MKTFVSLVAFLAPASIMAQAATPTPSSSSCLADYIVEDCLSSTQARQAECGTQDYSCQCAAYQAIATCYTNCPNDPRQASANGQVTQFCALASQYASTNSVQATGSAARSSAPAATATATATDQSDSTGTPTGSTSSTSSSSSANSAANLAISAGGLLAAVAGVMGVLL